MAKPKPVKPTTDVTFGMNLDSRTEIFHAPANYDPAPGSTTSMASLNVTPDYIRSFYVYDSLGKEHLIYASYLKTAENIWSVEIFATEANDISGDISGSPYITHGEIQFNSDGTLRSVDTALTDSTSIQWTNGADQSEINFNFGALDTDLGLSQYPEPFRYIFVNAADEKRPEKLVPKTEDPRKDNTHFADRLGYFKDNTDTEVIIGEAENPNTKQRPVTPNNKTDELVINLKLLPASSRFAIRQEGKDLIVDIFVRDANAKKSITVKDHYSGVKGAGIERITVLGTNTQSFDLQNIEGQKDNIGAVESNFNETVKQQGGQIHGHGIYSGPYSDNPESVKLAQAALGYVQPGLKQDQLQAFVDELKAGRVV